MPLNPSDQDKRSIWLPNSNGPRWNSLYPNGNAPAGYITPPPGVSGMLLARLFNFDNVPDYTSATDMLTLGSTRNNISPQNTGGLPSGWDALYVQDEWYPQNGYTSNHPTVEILTSNLDKTRLGTGKSYVQYRESNSPSQTDWRSDGQLVSRLDANWGQYRKVYVEFWIRFSPNWYGLQDTDIAGWAAKFFRIGYWNGVDPTKIFSGFQGDLGPIAIMQYSHNQYGVRNDLALRGGGNIGVNYNFGKTSGRDFSFNFGSSTVGQGYGGVDPQIPDLVNGGYLINYNGTISHKQVYGDTGVWTKVGMYVEMNTAIGAPDGILTQWINDEQFNNITDIDWIGASIEVDANTNFAIGDTVTGLTSGQTWVVQQTHLTTGLYFVPVAGGAPTSFYLVGETVQNQNGQQATVTKIPTMSGWNYFAVGGNSDLAQYPVADLFEDWHAVDDGVILVGSAV
jgi:hypothetical protein